MSLSLLMDGTVSLMRLVKLQFDPGNVAANGTSEQTIAIPGLKTGDFVMVNRNANVGNIGIVNARVTADDTLAITFMNNSAGGVNSNSLEFVVLVVRAQYFDIDGIPNGA